MGEGFGDFREVKETDSKAIESEEQEGVVRVRLPRRGELLGLVAQRLGGNRMDVKTTDGKTRNCRVPGRFKRRFWLRPGDAVIIIPWPDDDSKGDIVFQYSKGAVYQLKKRGLLSSIEERF